jgi:hypothetical protein
LSNIDAPRKHRTSRTVEDRLLAKRTITPEGCWLFTGSLLYGYGRMSVGGASGTTDYAHRVAYRLWIGDIPDGHTVGHTCGQKACFRPEHLVAKPSRAKKAEQLTDLAGRAHTPKQIERAVAAANEAYWRTLGSAS